MQWIPLIMIYYKSTRTWLFLLYVLIIISLSLTSGSQFNLLNNLWKYDKIIHFIEYFGFGFLLINMFMIAPLTREIKILLILLLLIFPFIDESIQSFTPSRISDINDAIVDVIGGLIGSYVRLNVK